MVNLSKRRFSKEMFLENGAGHVSPGPALVGREDGKGMDICVQISSRVKKKKMV